MDSVVEDDITLPLDFDRSTNLAKFKEAVAAGTGGDMLDSSAEFSEGLAVRPRTTGAASQDGSGSPPTKTMKDYEYQISELKKENFGLKLRIYFLEERMNQSLSDTPQDVFKANIELKVTVEKLKKELVEKQELLVKASNAVEALAQHSDIQIRSLTEDHDEELREIREGYENKLKEMEKELTVASRDVEDLSEKLTDTVNLNQQLNEKLLESTEGFHEDQRQLQVDTKATLDEKDRMIDDLRGENENLKDHLKELKESLDKQGQDDPQSQALDVNRNKIQECEKKIKHLTEELESRQNTVEELREQQKKVERANRSLKNQLHDKEVEQQLHSRSSINNSSSSQKEKEGAGSRDSELQRLNTKIQDLDQSLTATREAAHTAKRKWYQAYEEHGEILKARDAIIAALQSSLSAKDLEMEKLIQSMSGKEVEFQRLNNGKLLLEQRFDEMLKHKDRELAELMEKFKSLSQEHCSKMDALEEACQQVSAGAQEQLETKDRVIQTLAANNKEKDTLLGDLLESLREAGTLDDSGAKSPADSHDNLVKKLRKHLREKDRAVEVAVAEKLRAEQGKETELQQLRQSLRERDRLIEKINSAVLETDEKNKLLESTCNEKNEALQRLAASLKDQQKTQKEALETTASSLQEKEGVIQKLKNNLTNRDRELQELKEFVKSALSSPTEDQTRDDETRKAQELSELLKEKEKLLEDMFQERSRMSSAHEANSQRLMGALRDKETALKEISNDLTRVQTEKNATIQRLQQLLNSKDHELQALENSKAWASQEHDKLVNKLKMTIQDKDRTIESLAESGKEKDKMLMKLKESVKSLSKSPSPAEVAELKRTIDQLQVEVQKKDESLRKLESDYRANLRKLQADDREKNMKLQNLTHEVQTRDALLKQAQGTIENLRTRLQSMPKIEELQQKFAEQTQALAEAQKSKEQALVDSAALQKSNLELEAELKSKLNSVDMLTESAQMKDNIIKEMQEDQQKQLKDMKENIGYYQNKAQELEASNNQLRQSLMDAEDAKNALEQQLESYKRRLSTQASYGEEEVNLLRQEINNLKARLQRPGTPRRDSPGVGAGAEDQKPGVLQLQQMLEAQISETKRLNNILATEHALYSNLVQVVQEAQQGAGSESNVKEEMHTLKSLRAQLEEGIRQNDSLRAQLHDKLASRLTPSPHPPSPYDIAYQREIQELKSKLEDSERWNASLQARLNELQPRVSGVGGSGGRDSGDGGAVSPPKVQRLEQQLDNLKNQLQQSSELNIRLKNQLDEVNTLNIQTLADKDHVIRDQSQQIQHLQEQLDNTMRTFGALETRLSDANAKLEYYASHLNGSFEDTLLEREQELETLKQQLEELQRSQTNNRIASDMAAQTSPAKDWGHSPSGKVRELEQKLEESRTANEQFKKMLNEKANELKWLKQQKAATTKEDSEAKMREMSEIQSLRREYETGIRTNEELRRHLESEQNKSQDRTVTSDDVLDLRLQLDESSRRNETLERELNESARSDDEVNRLRHELQTATQMNESFGSRIRDLNESISTMKGAREETVRLQKERNDARRLNKTLTDQLKETRKSAEEVGRVQRELREAKMMNDQLGQQLAELLDHSASMKSQNEKLQHELQERGKVIETLQLRLQSKVQMQSRAVSPFSPMSASSPSPPRRFVDTQTSPGLNSTSPSQVSRAGSQNESLTEATEKMHQLNRMLLGENQLLRSKLKDSERLNATLKEENKLFSRIHNQSTQTQAASQKPSSTDDVLATYMAELRELRLRLEESIRTNDALRAQLEKRLSEGGGEGVAGEGPDKMILIRENDSLRTELLEKDRANERLKRAFDELRREFAGDKEQISLLRHQLAESLKVSENLKQELVVFERLYNLSAGEKNTGVKKEGPSYGSEGPRSPNNELENNAITLLLAEIRSLRVQLEKSIQTNNALRVKLEEQLSRPLTSPSQSPSRSQVTVVRQLNFPDGRGGDDNGSVDSARGPGSDASPVGDQQAVNQLKEKLAAITQLATDAYHRLKANAKTDSILSCIESIIRIVIKCNVLLETVNTDSSTRRTSGNSVEDDGQNPSLKLEIAKLRRRLLIQEDLIKRACERLEGTREVKERMRSEIVQQLSLTQNVISRARGTLEGRTRKDHQ